MLIQQHNQYQYMSRCIGVSMTEQQLIAIKQAIETLDNVRGDINPERSYCYELEDQVYFTKQLLLSVFFEEIGQ